MSTAEALFLEIPSRPARRNGPLPTPTWEIVRELTADDMLTLVAGKNGSGRKLQAVREIHHSIARLVALGQSNVSVSRATGKTPQYVGMLKDDPAFQELVQHYMAEADYHFQDALLQVTNLGAGAVQELQDRLDDEDRAKEFTNKDLMSLAEMALDRTGHGPTKTIDKRVTNTSDIIKAIKEEAQQRSVTFVKAKDLGPVDE